MGLQCTVLIGRPPVYRIRQGVAFVSDRESSLDHALSLECLQECVDRAQRALDRYRAGERDIVEGG